MAHEVAVELLAEVPAVRTVEGEIVIVEVDAVARNAVRLQDKTILMVERELDRLGAEVDLKLLRTGLDTAAAIGRLAVKVAQHAFETRKHGDDLAVALERIRLAREKKAKRAEISVDVAATED